MTEQVDIEARVIGQHEQLTFPLSYGGLARGILSFPTTELLERSSDADQREFQSYSQVILCKNINNIVAIDVQPSIIGDFTDKNDQWVLQINGFRWESPIGKFKFSEAPDEIRLFMEASKMPRGCLNMTQVDFMRVFIPARFHILDYIVVKYELPNCIIQLCKTPLNVKTLSFFGMTQALELHFEGHGVASLWIDGEQIQSAGVGESPIYFSLSSTDQAKRQEARDWGMPAGITAVNLSAHDIHLHTSQNLRFRTAIAHTYTKNEGPLPLA